MHQSQISRPQQLRRDQYLISTDKEKIDVDMVHHFLAHESYWATGITREAVERSIKHSLCYGLYDGPDKREIQIGFARVISDYSSFAYLADVFILASFRSQGLGKWLISCILQHPELQRVRKWMLNTKEAHKLYEPFGFRLHVEQDTYMTYRP